MEGNGKWRVGGRSVTRFGYVAPFISTVWNINVIEVGTVLLLRITF